MERSTNPVEAAFDDLQRHAESLLARDRPYRILVGSIVPDDLERQVNEHIAKGYAPVGGLHVRPGESGSYTFYQAVYRPTDPTPAPYDGNPEEGCL